MKAALCVVVFFTVFAIQSIRPFGNEVFYRYQTDTLRCAIALDRNYSSRDRRDIAFNYELLSIFGEKNGNYTKIEPPLNEIDSWKELLERERQIIVFRLNDTIPEEILDSIAISVAMEGNAAWAVTSDNIRLLNAINFQYNIFTGEDFFRQMTRRYFRSYSINYLLKQERILSISPYDGIIKKYSRRIGIDWRLLSSIIYQESQFSIASTSKKNAKGLMQIKPSTAKRYGIDDLLNPENNVKAGSMHFGRLVRNYLMEGVDSLNSIKFALAAYHGGEARLEELRSTALEKGFDPNDWESMKESFKVKDGTTSTYISEILERYDLYCNLID